MWAANAFITFPTFSPLPKPKEKILSYISQHLNMDIISIFCKSQMVDICLLHFFSDLQYVGRSGVSESLSKPKWSLLARETVTPPKSEP